MSTSRAEAFSDGVFAIAITLLVLEIHVPEPGSGSLGHELLIQWPSYAAYVVSFLTIGVIWINHHAMFRRLRVVDHSTLVWNLLLLMSVGVLPFTTALMAAYLKESDGESLAAAIYSGSFLVMSIFFAATNRHILFSRSGLLEESVDEKTRREALNRGVVGLLPYLLATVLAFASPYLTLAICGAVAAFYALPFASATASVTANPGAPGD
ncbi:MAG TPA: TMEM175 family protein [Solirubrobacterales bacterium]|nr:TMEM175 family protein [Solirubrobacterales bacterium]